MARSERKGRKCHCCGSALKPSCLWLCEECQALGRGRTLQKGSFDARELLQIAREREKQGIAPLKDMDMAEKSALAWLFRNSGYGSYGKLRAFVDEMGKLPPIKE